MAIKKNLTNSNDQPGFATDQQEQNGADQTSQTTALVEVNGAAMTAADLINVTADAYLPRIKVIYPIEVNPDKGILPKHGYQTMIQHGERFIEVPDNTALFGLAARDCMRKNTVVIEGVEIRYDEKNPDHKKAGGKFQLVYGPLKGQKPSAEYQAACTSDLFDRGVAWLVAAFVEGGCLVCELTGFKSMSKYWNQPLMQATSATGRVMVLTSSNHCYNLATGKNYLDPKKFNQYKFEPITEEQARLRNAAWNDQAIEIKAWLSK